MAANEAALEAMREAAVHVPRVIRTFMQLRRVSQEQLGDALGMSQTQISRRLNVQGALSAPEVAAVAALFGVNAATLYKPIPEALADLFAVSDEADASFRCSLPLAG